MEQQICIGKIVKTVGIKGEVKILPLTDSTKRFKNLQYVFIDDICSKVEHVSIRPDHVVLKLENFNTPEDALKLKDKLIFVDRKDAIKLEKNQFFIVDLIDSSIIYNNKIIGKIVDTENFGASDIIVFEMDNKQYQVPFLNEIFENIDVQNKKVFVSSRLFEVMVWKLIFWPLCHKCLNP